MTETPDDRDALRTIAVIDGNSLLHRAFHAVQAPMTAPDGRPTNACFGFISMLLKLIEDFAPSGIICAFDAGIPAVRLEALEQYKAQRPPTDPQLKQQFPLIEGLLTAMSIPVIRIEGFEGDDILGTVSALADARKNLRTLLITGDKDALQLASERTTIVTNKTGMSEVKLYDPAAVVERFGVDPIRVPDYLGLMGDSSDNIPGIPGVGPKTATLLLQDYKTLEGVIANASHLKGKLAERVAEGAELARASRKVATILRDVPLTIDFEDVRFPRFDADVLAQAFIDLGMMTQMRKLLKLAGKEVPVRKEGVRPRSALGTALPGMSGAGDAQEWGTPPALISDSTRSQAALDALLSRTEPLGVHLFEDIDREAQKSGQQLLVLDDRHEYTLYLASDDCLLEFTGEEALTTLARVVNAHAPLACYHSKQLLASLVPPCNTRPAYLGAEELLAARVFDLSIAAYLLNSESSTDDPLSLLEYFAPQFSVQDYPGYHSGALFAWTALRLQEAVRGCLDEAEGSSCLEEIEMPLTPVLVALERAGICVDTALLGEQKRELAIRTRELTQQAHQLAGGEFNLDSPKQVGEVLFEKLMLPPGRKTQRGYSTDATVLAELASLSPLPAIILEYRELAKLSSTYLEALPRLVAADGLIHTNFNQTVATTGRLSSSEPNLQNIPVRSDLGRQIRTAFVANAAVLGVTNAVFVSADYSQIELRLLAHLSEDRHLIEAFQSGEDFHMATAARIFGVSGTEVSAQLRSRAKAVNFGIVYGQQAFGLAQSLGIGFAEASEMIKRYFEAYPQVQDYLESLKEQARAQGWVATLYGRRRNIKEIHSSNANRRSFAERTAMNHPMQGSAADVIKLAMIQVAKRMQAEGFKSRMVLQVHDELDFNCSVEELDRLSALVKETMEGVASLKVPLVADVSSGANWALAH